MTLVPHDVKDLSLADAGKLSIEWAGQQMPVLKLLEARYAKEKPFKGFTLGACLHVTTETANLMIALQKGGATVVLCASNPLSTQDATAAALVKHYGISTYAIKGEGNKTYYKHLDAVLEAKPQITMDDGADLVAALHKLAIQEKDGTFRVGAKGKNSWEFLGSSEETTTGVIRLKAMAKDHALKLPVIAVNDSDTKHLFDNRYGTGQSTMDGILRSTNILIAGKVFVVAGYGWCSKGIAMRAKGMGANVIVTEVNPVRALEAAMDGFAVMKMSKAAKLGDIFVTATGDKDVIPLSVMEKMKDGAIIANSGHFDVEIDVAGLEKSKRTKRELRPALTEYTLKSRKRIYLLAEGRLVNLSAAEGHPAEVMDMSFANQAMAAEFFIKNQGKLKAKVYALPGRLDKQVARLKLKAMGLGLDHLTAEQRKYLSSWQEGT